MGINLGIAPEPAKHVSQIAEQLDRLEYLIGDIETEFSHIGVACHSVLNASKETAGLDTKEVGLPTPLASRLQGFNKRLSDLAVGMKMFHERVEL